MGDFPPSTAYRAAEVLTATPQRLHLMLVEGAIRFCRRAQDQWQQVNLDAARPPLSRAREIVGELLAAVRAGATGESRKLAAIYAFVFQQLVEAQLRENASLLGDAIRVLEVECETWREVCRRYGTVREADQAHGLAPSRPAAFTPHQPNDLAAGGFSCQA